MILTPCEKSEDSGDIATSELEVIISAEIETARRENIHQNCGIYCLNCGDEIPAARREFIPNVEFCVTCQNENKRFISKEMEYETDKEHCHFINEKAIYRPRQKVMKKEQFSKILEEIDKELKSS